MSMKSFAPTAEHLAFHKALENTIAEHGKTLDAAALLAILSNMVGQVIALQDQRTVTPAMAMQIVSANLQRGNLDAVERLLTETGGSA